MTSAPPFSAGGETLLAEKIFALRRSIEETAKNAGRAPDGIQFLLVTKRVALERIREAARAGVKDFGENRVQELLAKKKEFGPEMRWHMIGRLQTNKVKHVLGEAALIHSLDRPELARAIESQAAAKKIASVDCLIQVNSSGEAAKAGFKPGEVLDFAASLGENSPIRIRGLMTIGPLGGGESAIREAFGAVRDLQRGLAQKIPRHDWKILSMGMSGDYKIAIEEGATLLRIGSLIFGDRK